MVDKLLAMTYKRVITDATKHSDMKQSGNSTFHVNEFAAQ